MQYGNPDEDKFFINRGVKPPERIPHLTQEDIEARFESNRQARNCQWVQKGPDVYCTTCTNRHGTLVGINYRLTGTTASGLPMLKKIV